MSVRTKISATVDFEKDGKQFGYLDVPYSHDDSAWGTLRVPVAVVKNGRGPTLLVTGGNHGDEYEGQIAAMKLARKLDPGQVSGRVITIPFLNYPAVKAGRRVSPIDAVNMNRAFPGNPDGTVSSMVAHYVNHHILPLCDAVLDIHAGGKTLMFMPFACIHALPDADQFARSKAALLAFGAPISLVIEELDAAGMLDTAVEAMGRIFVSTELGGGGTATAETVRIAEHGLQRLMAHLGIVAEPEPEAAARPATRFMDNAAPGSFTQANHDGILEMLADLGAWVSEGQPIGQIHSLQHPELPPEVYHARLDGLLIGRHHPGLIRQGDCLALLAREVA